MHLVFLRMHPRSNTFFIDMDSLTSFTSLPEVTRVINYPLHHRYSATVPLKSFVMLLGSSQFTTAFNWLNSFAVPLIGMPFNSLVAYIASPLISIPSLPGDTCCQFLHQDFSYSPNTIWKPWDPPNEERSCLQEISRLHLLSRYLQHVLYTGGSVQIHRSLCLTLVSFVHSFSDLRDVD